MTSPLLAPGPAAHGWGPWNREDVQSVVGGYVLAGDWLLFYASGRNRGMGIGASTNGSHVTMGLARIRRDGFASLDAAPGGGRGRLVTRVLRWNATQQFLFVNHEARDLRVAVLSADDFAPIAPFVLANSVAVSGDSTRQQVTWREAGGGGGGG
eukprot:SAG22_NODE_5448_length_1012_cov_1.355969_3_plen_153_part_01